MRKLLLAAAVVTLCSVCALLASLGSSAGATATQSVRPAGTRTVAIAKGSRLRPGTVLHAPARVHGRKVRRYQWERCTARGRSCKAIRHATRRAYRLTRADVGHVLVVRMVIGSTIVQSKPTGVVGPPLPVNTALPVITDVTSGNVQAVTEGDVLDGTLGTWTGAVDYAWAWQHCTSAGACSTVASGGPTSNASTVPTYTVTSADQNDTIELVVTAYNTPQG